MRFYMAWGLIEKQTKKKSSVFQIYLLNWTGKKTSVGKKEISPVSNPSSTWMWDFKVSGIFSPLLDWHHSDIWSVNHVSIANWNWNTSFFPINFGSFSIDFEFKNYFESSMEQLELHDDLNYQKLRWVIWCLHNHGLKLICQSRTAGFTHLLMSGFMPLT